jgi:LPXTG-motif cell wall-anchored protein
VLGETLARTGAETQALLLVAGMALMLGGIAIYFGESPAAAQRRS